MYQSGTKPQPPIRSGEVWLWVEAMTKLSAGIPSSAPSSCAQLLDPTVIALVAVVPEVALGVDDREHQRSRNAVDLRPLKHRAANVEPVLLVPRRDRVHRSDPVATHIEAVGVLGPRRAGRGEMLGGAGELRDERLAQGRALIAVLDPGSVVVLGPGLDRDLGGAGEDVALLGRADREQAVRLAALAPMGRAAASFRGHLRELRGRDRNESGPRPRKANTEHPYEQGRNQVTHGGTHLRTPQKDEI